MGSGWTQSLLLLPDHRLERRKNFHRSNPVCDTRDRIKVTSPTSPNNSVSIGAIGTPSAPSDNDLSYVYQGGVTKQRDDGNSAATAQYDSDALAVVNMLADDGLKITFVPVRNFIGGLPSQMFDQLHPNDLGHSLLRDAFESVWK